MPASFIRDIISDCKTMPLVSILVAIPRSLKCTAISSQSDLSSGSPPVKLTSCTKRSGNWSQMFSDSFVVSSDGLGSPADEPQ